MRQDKIIEAVAKKIALKGNLKESELVFLSNACVVQKFD
jgi:hypothetical protein